MVRKNGSTAGLVLLLLDIRDVLRAEIQNGFKEECGFNIATHVQAAAVIYFTITIKLGVIYFHCSVTLLSDVPV